MKNLTKHIVFYLLTFFYLLSALEVNACGIKNTFFDEFDIYTESKEQSIEKVTIQQDKKSDEEVQSYIFLVSHSYFANPTILFQSESYFNFYSQFNHFQNRKLTILHSVWQI